LLALPALRLLARALPGLAALLFPAALQLAGPGLRMGRAGGPGEAERQQGQQAAGQGGSVGHGSSWCGAAGRP
ncbi:hypothetical protein HMPREF0731_2822, partial [Pseudoroseomonas cervicalis ATCC 49957]